MTRLRQLCVSKSALEGYVPWKALLKLENLEKLQICCTKYGLKGDVPQDIGKLNKLQVLSIGANNIKAVVFRLRFDQIHLRRFVVFSQHAQFDLHRYH